MRVLFFGTYDAAAHPRVAVLRDGLRDSDAATVVDECNVPLGLSHRRPGLDAAPALALPLLALRLGDLLVGARGAVRDAGAAPELAGRGGRRLPRAFRRAARPPARSAASRSCSTTWSVPVTRQRPRRGRRAAAAAAAPARRRGAGAPPTSSSSTPTSTGTRCRRPTARRGGRVGARRWFAVRRPAGLPYRASPRPAADPGQPLRPCSSGCTRRCRARPMIGAALAALADDEDHPVEVTMIGSGQDLDETRALAAGNPRVPGSTGWTPPTCPRWSPRHDVCLGIFGTGPKAMRVVPNKVFQGAAAGVRRRHLGHRAAAPGARRRRRARARRRPGRAGRRAAGPGRPPVAPGGGPGRRRGAGPDAFTPAAVTAPLHDHLLAVVPRRTA